MPKDLGTESTQVEIPALAFLKGLGYEFLPGALTLPLSGERESIAEVILEKRFRRSIKRLNPWIDDLNVDKVFKRFNRADGLGSGLLEINECLYRDIVELRITVEQAVDGPKKNHTVRIVDFDEPYLNEWLVVNQFEVQGPGEQRLERPGTPQRFLHGDAGVTVGLQIRLHQRFHHIDGASGAVDADRIRGEATAGKCGA